MSATTDTPPDRGTLAEPAAEDLVNGAVTASPAGGATVNDASAETVSSLPAPAAQAIVSNARKAHS